ncbi:MAG TPA: glycosyltransferase [Rubrobacter sp.]|nr:glycosyltransferase [Rubrobacter sp.]
MKPSVVVLAGIRWNFLWQRHQTLATLFARSGYPTVFVETTGLAFPKPGKETLRNVFSRIPGSSRRGGKPPGQNNPTVYAPLTAPPTPKPLRWANQRFLVPRVLRDLRKIVGPRPLVIAYPPTRTTLDLISGLDPGLVLYDCSDDYEHFPGVPRDIARTERELLLRADLVSCTSPHLLEQARRIRPDAFLSGPAVDYERFAVLQDQPPAREIETVCFFGDATRERIDFEALQTIVRAGFRLRLVGGLDRVGRGLLETPGVDYRGEVPHEALPGALAGVDAFVLPYRTNALTRAVSPAKTYECLAAGRPVVAAPLPALGELRQYLYLARRPEDYVEILRGLWDGDTEEKVRGGIGSARENSWDARFAGLEAAICRAL